MRINKASKPKMASSCDQTWSYECSFTKMFSFKKQSWHSSYIKASYHPLMTYFCRDGMFLPILPQPRTALTSENGSFCFKQLIWTRNLRPENKENRFSLGVYHNFSKLLFLWTIFTNFLRFSKQSHQWRWFIFAFICIWFIAMWF